MDSNQFRKVIMDKSVQIEGVLFKRFSFKYVVGYDLITYLMEGDTEFIYADPTVSNGEIIDVVIARNKGLEHLVSSINRWKCSGLVSVVTRS